MSQRQKTIEVLSEESSKLRDIGNALGFLYPQLGHDVPENIKNFIAEINNDVHEIAETLENLTQELES